MVLLVQEHMGSSYKATSFPQNLRIRLAAFPNHLRPNISTCKSVILTPVTEAASLQSSLKSGKWLELDSTDDPDLQSHFPSTSKGYSMITKYINEIKYASNKACREGVTDKLFMDEMGTWSRLLADAVRP